MSERKSKKRNLTEGNLLKQYILFAIPLLLGSLFQQLYSTVDMMYVGNFLGKTDSAAVGASGTLTTCLIGLFTGISVGAGVIAARFWGQKDKTGAHKCMKNALIFGVIGGIVLTIVGLALSTWALHILNTPENIMEHALIYLRIYLFSVLPMIIYNMSSSLLRAIGDSRTPFLVLASGGILNVLLDALFIVVIRWGIAGAAFATVLSQAFTAIASTILLIRQENLLKEKWQTEGRMIWKIFSIGFPLGIQSMVLTLSNLVVQYFINGFGEDSVAAFAVYFRTESFLYLPILAFGQTMVTFTGQNYGAGKKERIQKAAWQCNILSAAIIFLLACILLVLGRPLISLFSNDEDVIALVLKIIHVTFPFYFLYSIQEVSGGIVRGMGRTLQSMMVILGSLCVIRLIILAFFVHTYHTITSVASVYPITWALAGSAFILYYIISIRKQL